MEGNKITLTVVELNDDLFIQHPDSEHYKNGITGPSENYSAIILTDEESGLYDIKGVIKKNLVVQFVVETIVDEAGDNTTVLITGYNTDKYVHALLSRRSNVNLERKGRFECDLFICSNARQHPTTIVYQTK